MTVAFEDVVQVTANMRIHGTDRQANVYYCTLGDSGSMTDAEAEATIADWVNAIYTCINSHILNSIEYIDIDIYNITQDRPMITQDWPVLTFGALADDDLPWGCAFLVGTNTGIKRKNGRKYFGGLGTGDMTDDGFWVSTLVTLFACVLLKLVGPQYHVTRTLYPGLWSKGTALWHRNEVAISDAVPAYQRRRRPGTGE